MDKPAAAMGGEYVKKGKLVRMQKHVENLKILADANDPMVRKRFEDGLGMSLQLSFFPTLRRITPVSVLF